MNRVAAAKCAGHDAYDCSGECYTPDEASNIWLGSGAEAPLNSLRSECVASQQILRAVDAALRAKSLQYERRPRPIQWAKRLRA